MSSKKYLSEYIHGYIYDELEAAKNRSPHTIKSYVTSLKLLIVHLAKTNKIKPENILIESLTYESIADYLKTKRIDKAWGPSTWNNRLAGILAFISYLSLINPKFLELLRRVQLISPQRIPKKEADYLEPEDIQTTLTWVPKNKTEMRDRMMILLFFATGIRNSELTSLKVQDLQWKSSSHIHLTVTGKGNKKRAIPVLDKSIVKGLHELIMHWELIPTEYMFCTRDRMKMSSANVRRIVAKYFKNSYPNKNITPHSLRHSAAMNWINSDIDLFTISSTLGHARVNTTQIYARSRYQLKEQRLGNIAELKLGDIRFKTNFKANEDLIKSLNLKISRFS